jgi:osmoprotectant transport system ATP-binding protein
MIRLEKIRKAFGSTVALNSYSVTVPRGETTVLIGPSGCGKSTVIRIITGLVKPDEGTVSIHGRMLTPQNVLEMRRRMGYVIQDGGLFPHLTARQNVVLMAEYLGRTREYIEANLVRLAALTKLPLDALERFPLQLSGGQNQRVSLMRALMLDPDILLLDEPLAALDSVIRFELQTDLKEIFAALNKTVLLVTHDLGEAAHLANRIVVMRDGTIVQQGTIGELVNSPAEPFVTRLINAHRSPLRFLDGG